MIDENLSWAYHIDYVSKKINQKLDGLCRSKRLLLIYVRNLFVRAMVLPFFDNFDIIWADRDN